MHVLIRRKCLSNATTKNTCTLLSFCQRLTYILDILFPVSYTHLDVYKRQARDVQAGQLIVVAFKICQGGTARDIQAGQLIVVAVKLCQGGTARDIQAGQFVAEAPFVAGAFKRCQGSATRRVQIGQLIVQNAKLCDIASNDDSLAGKGVSGTFRIFDTLDGHVAISFNDQSDFLSDGLGSGHRDDTLATSAECIGGSRRGLGGFLGL